MKYNNILETIGNTPHVRVNKLFRDDIEVWMKIERFNPGGSIKDRIGLAMIEAAEKNGLIDAETTIVEPTSGNTGIALAMIGAAKGYRVRLCMPECVSTERVAILQAFGAQVLLTPAREGTDGAIRRAHKICSEEPELYYMPNQFANPNNPLSHYETTGPEIWNQTQGNVDVFVAGLGTTGTLIGTARYLREQKSRLQVVAVEPTVGHGIQGLKNMQESIVPRIYDPGEHDTKVIIEDGEAFEITRRLATEQGIFVGMSSGAAVAATLNIASEMESGTIVTILPDRGERYLSTTLFRSICGKCLP